MPLAEPIPAFTDLAVSTRSAATLSEPNRSLILKHIRPAAYEYLADSIQNITCEPKTNAPTKRSGG